MALTNIHQGSRFVGEFATLVHEMVRSGRATKENAEAAARAFVAECGCRTIAVSRGGFRREYIVCDGGPKQITNPR